MAWTAGSDLGSVTLTSATWNAYMGATGSLEYLKDICDAPMKAKKNGAGGVGGRQHINFIEGSNVTLTVADDAGNDEIDVTIAASGSTLPTDSDGSGWVSVQTAASQGTKGAWTELIAAVSVTVLHLIISFNFTTAASKFEVDIGTGAAASEVAKVKDIPFAGNTGGGAQVATTPFSIASSTRIAARAANMDSATQYTVNIGVTAEG